MIGIERRQGLIEKNVETVVWLIPFHCVEIDGCRFILGEVMFRLLAVEFGSGDVEL